MNAVMSPPSGIAGNRRAELADFLRTRRARLTPDEVGLTRGARRRVAGLRREEVADLAEIGVTWYTWLEQARPVNVSGATLERIAAALNLDSSEREHLFELAGHPAPLRPDDGSQHLLETARQMLTGLEPNPAYLLNSRWDIIAWNQAATDVFGDFSQIPEARRNLVWVTFMDQGFRHTIVEWERFAHCVIAHFRSDSGADIAAPRWAELTDDLLRQSPEFCAWWPCHEVASPLDWQKQVHNPAVGTLSLNSMHLQLPRAARLKLVAYLPAPETDTARKLAELAAMSSPDKRTQTW